MNIWRHAISNRSDDLVDNCIKENEHCYIRTEQSTCCWNIETNSIVWRSNIKPGRGQVTHLFSSDGGVIFVQQSTPSSTGTVVCLDAHSGVERWRFAVGSAVTAAAAVGSVICVGAFERRGVEGGTCRRFDLDCRTGQRIFQQQLPAIVDTIVPLSEQFLLGLRVTPARLVKAGQESGDELPVGSVDNAACAGDLLYFSGCELDTGHSGYYCYRLPNLERVARADLPEGGNRHPVIPGSEGKVITMLLRPDRKVVCLDLATGEIEWSFMEGKRYQSVIRFRSELLFGYLKDGGEPHRFYSLSFDGIPKVAHLEGMPTFNRFMMHKLSESQILIWDSRNKLHLFEREEG